MRINEMKWCVRLLSKKIFMDKIIKFALSIF